jgi:hypothetical protein
MQINSNIIRLKQLSRDLLGSNSQDLFNHEHGKRCEGGSLADKVYEGVDSAMDGSKCNWFLSGGLFIEAVRGLVIMFE